MPPHQHRQDCLGEASLAGCGSPVSRGRPNRANALLSRLLVLRMELVANGPKALRPSQMRCTAARHCGECLPAQTAEWRAADHVALTTSAAPARTRQEPLSLPFGCSVSRPLRSLPGGSPPRPGGHYSGWTAPEGLRDAQEGARSPPGRSRGSHGRRTALEAAMTPQEGAGKPARAGRIGQEAAFSHLYGASGTG